MLGRSGFIDGFCLRVEVACRAIGHDSAPLLRKLPVACVRAVSGTCSRDWMIRQPWRKAPSCVRHAEPQLAVCSVVKAEAMKQGSSFTATASQAHSDRLEWPRNALASVLRVTVEERRGARSPRASCRPSSGAAQECSPRSLKNAQQL
eukprot:4323047-Pleurochrysis_carterae.AAC.2